MYKEIEDLFSVVSLVESPGGAYDVEFEVTDQLKEWFTKRQGATFFDEVFFRKWFHGLFESFMQCRTVQEEKAIADTFIGLLDSNKELSGSKNHG